jgi:hypothetical protein
MGRYPRRMADDKRTEPLVVAATYSTIFEADVAVAKLTSAGIDAVSNNGAPGGPAYGSAFVAEHTVMVFKSDLEIAQTLLAEE